MADFYLKRPCARPGATPGMAEITVEEAAEIVRVLRTAAAHIDKWRDA